jgi:uncharacterized protein (AIM24 family)
MAMDVIDYKVFGAEMQFVEIELDTGVAAFGEDCSMFYMEDNIQIETIFGDGSAQQSGFFGKLMGAGKRLLTGESLFTTVYSSTATEGKRKVAFGAPYPGKIIPIDLAKVGGTFITQKDAFLCAAKGVSLGIAFQRKLGAGFFGGEGFIMQKLEGDGLAFLHAGGTMHRRDLKPGEILRVDTGCLVGLQPTVEYDIQMVPGIKTALFGGEGLFFATLRGPGMVLLQSLPFARLASRIFAAAPVSKGGGGSGGEQGGLLGNLLGGDRD